MLKYRPTETTTRSI